MRILSLFLAVSALTAAPHITVTPTANLAPAWLYLPVVPGGRAGVVVVASSLAADADAVQVTLRYRAADGRTFSRTQTAAVVLGARFASSVFWIGRDVQVLSASLREIRYESVEEIVP